MGCLLEDAGTLRSGQRTQVKYNPKIVIAYWIECGIPEPLVEYRFCSDRKWRFDFAWENWKGKWGAENCDRFPVALEVQGGIFIKGGHNRGAQMLKEWEKFNTAACLGWRLLYCQPKDLCMQSTVQLIKKALRI